jgi:ribosomal protein S6E (S10)
MESGSNGPKPWPKINLSSKIFLSGICHSNGTSDEYRHITSIHWIFDVIFIFILKNCSYWHPTSYLLCAGHFPRSFHTLLYWIYKWHQEISLGFFWGTSQANGCIEMELIAPSQPETHWSGQWMQTLYFLWEADGLRSYSWRSGWRMKAQVSSRNDRQGFPLRQGVLTHGQLHLLLRRVPATDQGELERESTHLLGLHCGCQLSALNLVIIKKKKIKERRVFLDWLIQLSLVIWGPKELAESANFSVSLKKVRKSLSKEGKKPRTKAPKIQCLVIPCVLQHKWQCIALKKQHSK